MDTEDILSKDPISETEAKSSKGVRNRRKKRRQRLNTKSSETSTKSGKHDGKHDGKHEPTPTGTRHQFLGVRPPPREFGSGSEPNPRTPVKAKPLNKTKHIVRRPNAAKPGVATGDGDTEQEAMMNSDGEFLNEGDPTLSKRESQPAGNIYRLVYAPQPYHSTKMFERGAGRCVDYLFLLANFVTLILCVFLVLLGLSILSYTSSIQSILGEDGSNKTAVLHTTRNSNSSTVCLVLILGAMLQVLNVYLGVYSAVQGLKSHLVVHLVLCLIFLIIGVVFTYLITKDANCNKKDISLVQETLLDYIRLFGTEVPKEEYERSVNEMAVYQLDSIQIGLSCCGALGWSDYMDPLVLSDGNGSIPLPYNVDLDEIETVFPSSCCRPWWVRNVHCSKGAHLWAHPSVDKKIALKFRERINQNGCIWKLKHGCERLLLMIKTGMWIYVIADAILTTIKLVCVYTIERVMWKIIKKKKAFIASDLGHVEVTDGVDIETEDGLIRLPTEDEIHIITARTDFNNFLARVKRTQIGKWIKQARKSVFLSYEKREPEMENRPKESVQQDWQSLAIMGKK